jgi:YtfJ family uncharacterized protein
MKSTRLPYLARVATVAILFQSAVFAVEQPIPGLDGKEDRSLETGQSLPLLDIREGGEIYIGENTIVEKPWSSKSFESKGQVQFVQYVAANRGAVSQNKMFTDALKKKQYSSEELETTIIVHMADTISLAKGFVVRKMAKNKARHQSISFVIDDKGLGLERWGMKNKSCAVIILDASGKVLFAKDGPLSETEVENTIKLIDQHMI